MNLRLFTLALLFFSPTICFAYLDPGTGSLIIQGVIAAIAAAGMTIRLYWYRIRAWYSRNDPEAHPEKSSNEDPTKVD
ncbi:MAG TPA: hypothetical protein EYQ14_18030 [Gammaproteobacteria bacterium]|nr:hypothetical protein [Gammaproteobacteria bacterium]HIL95744.1 hypothetical protein [Pseudomonadales bacterium]